MSGVIQSRLFNSNKERNHDEYTTTSSAITSPSTSPRNHPCIQKYVVGGRCVRAISEVHQDWPPFHCVETWRHLFAHWEARKRGGKMSQNPALQFPKLYPAFCRAQLAVPQVWRRLQYRYSGLSNPVIYIIYMFLPHLPLQIAFKDMVDMYACMLSEKGC